MPVALHEPAPSPQELEITTCQLLGITDLYVSEANNSFNIDKDDIVFPLSPQIVEVEQKLELNLDNEQAIKTKAALSKPDSQWNHKIVEGINLIHHKDKIYVHKRL